MRGGYQTYVYCQACVYYEAPHICETPRLTVPWARLSSGREGAALRAACPLFFLNHLSERASTYRDYEAYNAHIYVYYQACNVHLRVLPGVEAGEEGKRTHSIYVGKRI